MSYKTIAKNRRISWKNSEKAEVVWTQLSEINNSIDFNLRCIGNAKTYYTNLLTNHEQLLASYPCPQKIVFNNTKDIIKFVKEKNIFSKIIKHGIYINRTTLQNSDGVMFLNTILTEGITTLNFSRLDPNFNSNNPGTDNVNSFELCSSVKERKFAILKSFDQKNNYLFTYDKLKNYISFYRIDYMNCRYLNSIPFNDLQVLIDIQVGKNNFLLTYTDNEVDGVLLQKSAIVPMDGRSPKIVHKDNANKSFTQPVLVRSWNKVLFSSRAFGIENSLYSLDLD